MSVRLFYIDDSGAEPTKLSVFGWVELLIPDWSTVLRGWLDWRTDLYRTVGIPTDYELHATKFANGRGHPTGTEWDTVKSHRPKVLADALGRIASLPGLSTGAVYQRTAPGVKHHVSKADAYAALVRRLDARLSVEGEYGLIVMDGNGTDPTYRPAHRELKLASRSLLEDPFFHGSDHSQWVQMCDLVAYAAYMHLACIPGKEFAWGWWRDHLAISAATGETPLNLKTPT